MRQLGGRAGAGADRADPRQQHEGSGASLCFLCSPKQLFCCWELRSSRFGLYFSAEFCHLFSALWECSI